MSRKNIVFTDTIIKRLKPANKEYRKSEGNGFTIRIMPSSYKSWLYLYAINGKRRCMNLGQYPEVTLETARYKFATARKLVKNGIDPLEIAEQAQKERSMTPTVRSSRNYYNLTQAVVSYRRTLPTVLCKERSPF